MLLFAALIAFTFADLDLTYFDGRGRAEQFRLFFASQQTPYNDIRLSGDQFEKLKKTFPWGHVPVLNSTAHPGYLADTAALNVYLGKVIGSGLWPSDLIQEQVLLDYSGASEDLRLSKNSILGTGCGAGPAPPAAQPKFLKVLQDWLFYFERNLKTNGYNGPFLLGSMFTPVDCRVWDVLDQVQGCMNRYPNLYRAFPYTTNFTSSFANLPNIAAYLRTRK